jgi:hypothetical protein
VVVVAAAAADEDDDDEAGVDVEAGVAFVSFCQQQTKNI